MPADSHRKAEADHRRQVGSQELAGFRAGQDAQGVHANSHWRKLVPVRSAGAGYCMVEVAVGRAGAGHLRRGGAVASAVRTARQK